MPNLCENQIRIEANSRTIAFMAQQYIIQGQFDPDLAVPTENRGETWGSRFIDVDMTVRNQNYIGICCLSAWSPPNQFCLELSLKFPQAKISMLYEEQGQDFCGLFIVQNGQVLLQEHDELRKELGGQQVTQNEEGQWINQDGEVVDDFEQINPFNFEPLLQWNELPEAMLNPVVYVVDVQSLQECSICLNEQCQDPVTTTCNHMFCRQCILQQLATRRQCPLCRAFV